MVGSGISCDIKRRKSRTWRLDDRRRAVFLLGGMAENKKRGKTGSVGRRLMILAGAPDQRGNTDLRGATHWAATFRAKAATGLVSRAGKKVCANRPDDRSIGADVWAHRRPMRQVVAEPGRTAESGRGPIKKARPLRLLPDARQCASHRGGSQRQHFGRITPFSYHIGEGSSVGCLGAIRPAGRFGGPAPPHPL